MKKLLSPIIFPLLFLVTTINSCGIGKDSQEAEKYIETFYEYLSEKDYDKAMEMVDEESLAVTPYDDWKNVLIKKEQLGKFKGFKKDMGFNTSYKNGITTVKLSYTCTYEKFTVYENFTLVKRGEAYKILVYEYNTNKSELSN